jgi:isoquinoline 1-oxidoreductase subunit alpha
MRIFMGLRYDQHQRNSAAVDTDGDMLRIWVLRDVPGMTGTKFGCGRALRGACSVHLDDADIRSCLTPVDSIGESKVTTIEAIVATSVGARNEAWPVSA